MTLEEIKQEIDRIYYSQPEKRDKDVYVYTPENQLTTEQTYPIQFIDDNISDRIDINILYI